MAASTVYFSLRTLLLHYAQTLNADNFIDAAALIAASGMAAIWLLALGLLFGGKLALRIEAQRG